MKKGDKVMVQVSRDKTRGATIDQPGGVASFVRFDMADDEVLIDNAKIIPNTLTATKHDIGKNRLELVPIEAIEQIGLAMTFGSSKYEDNNWRNGFEWERLRGSTMRHLLSWAKGEDKDPESGLSHLAHLGACVSMLIAHEQLNYGEDNRVNTTSNNQ